MSSRGVARRRSVSFVGGRSGTLGGCQLLCSATGGERPEEWKNLRGVDPTTLRGRVALIVDKADLARRLGNGGGDSIGGLLVVEKCRGHDLASHGAEGDG